MRRARHGPGGESVRTDVDTAISAMPAEDLRAVVHELLLELDDRAHARVIGALVARAARGGSGWAPAAVSGEQVDEVLAFVTAAERVGHADPPEVDEHLRRGSAAFLRKDYRTAHRIFGALLPPIGNGDIDLGQDEMVDEVLGTDTAECAARHAVSAYMIAAEGERAEAVRAAIHEVRGFEYFWEPLRKMERVAVEPLPGMKDFLPRWHALLASRPTGERKSDWDANEDRWLREVVRRLDGADGLAKIARSTRRADDLRAWCKFLVDAGDWNAALSAFGEAAELVAEDYTRGEFLDGAALAARCLGRRDLPAYLERAWRESPSMLRLRRWLGSSTSKASLKKLVAEALEACPKHTVGQRALLHVLARDFAPAAELLATAPGLGWSNGEHPGHLLFPLFARLLGGQRKQTTPGTDPLSHRGLNIEELEAMTAVRDEPRLAAPEVDALLELAGVDRISDPAARATVLGAMKKAAENRVAGVTGQQRRRHYGHAAELVSACLACDGSIETTRWAAALRADYRRFHALRVQLDRAMGTS